MTRLVSCKQCGGFLALALRACPHCDAPLDRTKQALLGLAALAGGGAVSMTLMACYGGACMNGDCREPHYPGDAGATQEGHTSGSDGGAPSDGG